MSIFKCKMCGGNLEITEDMSVCECEYCGTKQTVPRLDSDRKANLYDRANHFRRNNDYDKAIGIYEQILNEDNNDAEAYWSLVLCRYGIEYVEDPQSHKRIPTINRAQFTSIYMDEDYKSALQYADTYQKTIYEEEAKTIDDIQKGILEISSNEEPFDVFICYKETDANGRRTQDSVLANDLYHQLTQEGFKVFFSRITLEDKLGMAYEPYIFAALNSAKVMVVLGTRPEYFSAVWVKNEWSRYLALVKNSGGKKTLIPAYRDMDPYDLPEEFSHLQAQNMSKLGFMQDLIRGIRKIAKADEAKTTEKESVVHDTRSAYVEPLLRRGFMFLEDEEWEKADNLFEQILNQEPENAQAYLGKMMVEFRACNENGLAKYALHFDQSNNFKKFVRFGDEKLSAKLQEYSENEKIAVTTTFNSLKNVFVGIKEKYTKLQQEEDIYSAQIDKMGLFAIKEKKRIEKEIDSIRQEKHNLNIIAGNEKAVIDYLNNPEMARKVETIYPLAQYIPAYFGKTDEICFGHYGKDNSSCDSLPIIWQVIDRECGRMLVVSKYAYCYRAFNEKHTKVTWKTCSLREWMNGDFLNSAFSPEEQKCIFGVTHVDITDKVSVFFMIQM